MARCTGVGFSPDEYAVWPRFEPRWTKQRCSFWDFVPNSVKLFLKMFNIEEQKAAEIVWYCHGCGVGCMVTLPGAAKQPNHCPYNDDGK